MSTIPIAQAIESVRPFVMTLLGEHAKSFEKSGGQLKSKCDELTTKLLATGLAYKERVTPERVIPDMANRDGQGADPFDMQVLLERILTTGWSYSKTIDSTAFELPPNKKPSIDFAVNLVEGSGGVLPPVDVNNVRYTSVGGTHTVLGLGAVNHSCESFLDELCVDGRLSREKAVGGGGGGGGGG
eukprot:871209-Pyramimonas_sp.AAC.2